MQRKITLTIIIVLIIIISIILIYPKDEKEIMDTNEKSKNNFISMMLEEKTGSNKFIENTDLKFPLEGYHFNSEESGCENGGTLSWNSEKQKVEASLITSDKCYAYFDNVQVKSEFDYTGDYEEYVVPSTGTYKIELWGASGGLRTSGVVPENSVGRGAYTKGNIFLKKGEKIYVYVGENIKANGEKVIGFNGGGRGESAGGGATDIRLTEGKWDNFDSLKTRVMVAAGGGGGIFQTGVTEHELNQRGDGGALNGIDAKWYVNSSFDYSGHGATQVNGGEPGILFSGNCDPIKIPEMTGKFGIGGYSIDAHEESNTYTSSGGGGGYYGGGHGNHPGYTYTGGGGGSSFISGYPGCNAIDENSTEDAIIHTDQPVHYSSKVFTNAEMIAGNATMPSPNGGTEEGHIGNGYAKITLIK